MRRECVKWIREVGLGLYNVPNGLRGFPGWVFGYKALTGPSASLFTRDRGLESGCLWFRLICITRTHIYIYIYTQK